MKRVRQRIRRIAASPVPVLIHGETGTGKELCAEALVVLSGRKPFVAVNCAAFAEGVLDSELFGHERGAFTGADRARSGLIASANGGVLFLDELAEVPASAQAKLLRTLESGEYRPVGSSRTLRSDFRIVAATGGDLDQFVADGKLRADLLHRLGALRIVLPPLRERLEDLPLLAREFVQRYQSKAAFGPAGISPGAMALLGRQAWPGNVRQLRNVIEAAAAFAGDSEQIEVAHLLEVLTPEAPAPPDQAVPTLQEAVRRAEERALMDALRHAGENREGAARLLAISQATLYRKMDKHFRKDNGRAGAEHGNGSGRDPFSS